MATQKARIKKVANIAMKTVAQAQVHPSAKNRQQMAKRLDDFQSLTSRKANAAVEKRAKAGMRGGATSSIAKAKTRQVEKAKVGEELRKIAVNRGWERNAERVTRAIKRNGATLSRRHTY